jgi:LPXTG-site transpeptidase (sortase) family protein
MQTKRKNKEGLIILGSLLVFIGLSMFGYKYYIYVSELESEDIAIEEFYQQESELAEEENNSIQQESEEISKVESPKYDYIAMLTIPKINLQRGLVAKNSKYNNIRYNVMIHKVSNMPDEEKGNVILIAHSGSASYSFFKNLNKLKLSDLIKIDYKGKTYNYKIVDIYDIEKTGKASIKRNHNKSTITLITCRHNTNRQIVVIAEMI